MAYPYASLDTTKVNATVLNTDHPNHHDALGSALNDLLAELGSNPGGVSVDLTTRLSVLESAVNPVAIAKGGTGQITAGAALLALNGEVAGSGAAAAMPFAGRSSAVQRFHRAFANRATAPVKVMFIGDSEFDFAFVNRAAVYTMGKLTQPSNIQFNGPSNVHCAGSSMPGDASFGLGAVTPVTWTSVGSPTITSAGVQAHRGFAGCALKMTDGQAAQCVAVICDQVKFYWLTPLAGVGATLEFFVDGVSVHTSSAAAAGNFTYSIGSPPASHTIKILSHGETLFDFVQFYNGNTASYLQPWSAVHTGYTTADLNACTDLAGYLASINPDLVILETVINDTDGPTYYTDMTTLVGTVRANTTASVMVMMSPYVNNGNTKAVWDVKRQRVYRIAAEQNTLVCDATNWFPDLNTADPLGYTSDGVHVQSTGANGRDIWANAIVQTLLGSHVEQYPLWEAKTTYAGNSGHLRAYDSNQGGMTLGFFLQRADTQPILKLFSDPNLSLNGLASGPGGTSGSDSLFLRSNAGVWGVTSAVQLGGSTTAQITSADLCTATALPACTAAGSGVGKTLTGNANGQLADIDFVTPVANYRIVVKDQATLSDNGLYVLTQLGDASHPFILTRAADANLSSSFNGGMVVFIAQGLNYGASFVRSRPASGVVIETTPIVFTGGQRPNTTPADVRFGSSRSQARFDSDFDDNSIAITSSGRWTQGQPVTIFISGAAAQATQQDVAETRCGVIELETGSTNAGVVTMNMTTRGVTMTTTKRWRFYTFARLDTNLPSAGVQDYTVWHGFMDNLGSVTDPTLGMFFRTDTATGNWFAVTRHGGVETATNTNIAYSSSYQSLRIEFDETSATVQFWIGSVPITGVPQTNLPASPDSLNPGSKIKKTAGTTTRGVFIDYTEVDMPNSRNLNQFIP